MEKTTKAGATPRLRFPEHRGSQAWSEAKLGELVTTVTPPARLQTSSYMAAGAFPIVDQSQDQFCGWTDDARAVITGPLPLVVFGDHTCALKIVRQPFAQGADGIKILRANDSIDAEFLFQSLSHHPLEADDYKRHFSALKERRVLFPDIKSGEQQRIVTCLTSLDDVIAAQARKVEALTAHKRGLMQQLFPREGEMVPRLRFPEFGRRPDWKVMTVGELYDFKQTTAYSRDQLNYETGAIRCIHYGDIHTRFATQFRLGTETVPFINSDQPTAHIKPDAYCQEGDLVLADASEDLADVGKTIELVDLDGERVIAGTHTILARQKTQDVIVGFGGYLFKSRAIRAQVEREAQGTKVMGISPSRLAGVRLGIPQDELEQKRIADCLSSLDNELAAQAASLAAVRTHKAGLMQRLFPSPEGT